MNNLARSAKQLGNVIQQRRMAKTLTQTQLANLIGTGQKTISKIENGNPATRLDTLFSVLGALDLQLHVNPRTTDLDLDELLS
jgi:HTH-type transcriptional regulator/antitoxin HipB